MSQNTSSINHLSKKMQEIIEKRIEKAKRSRMKAITFKFCGVGEKNSMVKDEQGNNIEIYKGGSINAECSINDIWTEGSEDAIKNHIVYSGKTVPKRNADGVLSYVPAVEPIDFTNNGYLHVPLTNKSLLARMWFADENKEWNHFLAKKDIAPRGIPMWEEVKGITGNTGELAMEVEIKGDAIRYIKNMELAKLKEYTAALLGEGAINGKNSGELRHDLMIFVDKPGNARAFMNCNCDAKLKVELKIKDGIAYNALSFNPDSKKWTLDSKEIPLEVSPGQVPESALAEFLMTKAGDKIYSQLKAIFEAEVLE